MEPETGSKRGAPSPPPPTDVQDVAPGSKRPLLCHAGARVRHATSPEAGLVAAAAAADGTATPQPQPESSLTASGGEGGDGPDDPGAPPHSNPRPVEANASAPAAKPAVPDVAPPAVRVCAWVGCGGGLAEHLGLPPTQHPSLRALRPQCIIEPWPFCCPSGMSTVAGARACRSPVQEAELVAADAPGASHQAAVAAHVVEPDTDGGASTRTHVVDDLIWDGRHRHASHGSASRGIRVATDQGSGHGGVDGHDCGTPVLPPEVKGSGLWVLTQGMFHPEDTLTEDERVTIVCGCVSSSSPACALDRNLLLLLRVAVAVAPARARSPPCWQLAPWPQPPRPSRFWWPSPPLLHLRPRLHFLLPPTSKTSMTDREGKVHWIRTHNCWQCEPWAKAKTWFESSGHAFQLESRPSCCWAKAKTC